jgi:glycosyltransferase involved in cell wall biosynthesis
MKFSIIIPTFNAARSIDLALSSITQQRFSDFEVLVMDGESTDETLKIVDEHASRFSQIKIYSEKDKGIYDAMNKGVLKSQGEWLFFLGSDDSLIDEYVLQQVAEFLDTNELDVVYGNVHHGKLNAIYDGAFDEKKISFRNICHQSIFYRRAVFDNVGLFDISFKVLADWDHNFRWFFSDHIKNAHLDMTIARYADGGYSTVVRDERFNALNSWRQSLARRKRLTLLQKGKVFLRQLKKMYITKKWWELRKIFLDSPKFFFG